MKQDILDKFKKQGHRITRARTALVSLFLGTHTPLSVENLRKKLLGEEIHVNKTTIYRELKFLLREGVVREVGFGEGQKRYEFARAGHHHHAVCVNCKKIVEVELPDDVSLPEKKIAKLAKFKVLNHSLEFFGLCLDCK